MEKGERAKRKGKKGKRREEKTKQNKKTGKDFLWLDKLENWRVRQS